MQSVSTIEQTATNRNSNQLSLQKGINYRPCFQIKTLSWSRTTRCINNLPHGDLSEPRIERWNSSQQMREVKLARLAERASCWLQQQHNSTGQITRCKRQLSQLVSCMWWITEQAETSFCWNCLMFSSRIRLIVLQSLLTAHSHTQAVMRGHEQAWIFSEGS